MTISALLHAARQRLESISETAGGDVQRLMEHVLDVERAYLLAHPETVVDAQQAAQFEALVQRCAAGEPLAYVLGLWPWYDREFIVTPSVLIPRPETELLLEQALAWSEARADRWRDRTLRALDVGTGSGILAVTFAALRPGWCVDAVDISADALSVARRNATLHRTTACLAFYESDLLDALPSAGPRYELLMANLPYIPSDDIAGLAVGRVEPRLALDGGADGLRLVRRLLHDALPRMTEDGLLLLELEARQGQAAGALARAAFPGAAVSVLRDYAGLDRVLRIQLGKDD